MDFKAYRKGNYPAASIEMIGDHIIVVYFDNPPVNAANRDRITLSEPPIFEGIAKDDDIRCVIVTGKDTEYKGKHYFCAGADVKQWSARDGQPATKQEGYVRPMIFPRAYPECELLWNCGKPSIAMVNGAATGVGADWAICTDLSIASDDARIGWSYVQRGVVAMEGGTWLLPRRIGVNRAMELLITGKIIDAQEAYRVGIFNQVVPHDQLLDATMEYANWFVKGPPTTIGITRAMVWQGLDMTFPEHLKSIELAAGCINADRAEAMAAWVEKREATYEGQGRPS
jgi:enoyl-CoA hydratase/carnithine racemase